MKNKFEEMMVAIERANEAELKFYIACRERDEAISAYKAETASKQKQENPPVIND